MATTITRLQTSRELAAEGIRRSPRRAILALGVFSLSCVALTHTLFEAALICLGVAALLIASFPLLTRRWWHPVEPIGWVVFLVIWGVTLKLTWVGLRGITSDQVARLLLHGNAPRLLLPGVVAVILSMIFLILGYSVHLRPFKLERGNLARREQWLPSALTLGCGLITALALVGFVIFVVQSGGLGSLSAKRFTELEGGSQARLTTLNYMWFRFAALAEIPFLVLLAWNRRQDRRSPMTSLLLATSGFLALAVPIFASNRARIGLVVLDVLVISYLLHKKVSRRLLLFGGIALLVASTVLLVLRSTEPLSLLQSVERTVFGRDAFDVSKTGQIVSSGKHSLGGQTIVGWVVAAIPDSILPSKPLWAGLDRYVWTEIIGGAGVSVGVPPGLIGELYLNFWWPGIAIASFFFGMALRLLWQSFRHILDRPNAAVVYGVAVSRFTLFTLSNDVGTGITKTALDLIPLIALLMFISRIDTRRQAAESALTPIRARPSAFRAVGPRTKLGT